MRPLTNAEVEEITESLILANTPGFLLARLLKSELVYGWVEEATEVELVELYQTSSGGDPTDTNAAVAYAALVAILVKRREACEGFDVPLELDRLDWGQKIVDIAYRSAHFTTRQIIVGSSDLPPPSIIEQGQIISGSTTTDLQMTVKPHRPGIRNADASNASPEVLRLTGLDGD